MYVQYHYFHLDSSCDVTRDKLTRVGHICATCFVDYKWAFRLLWLHCFKPCDHQFAGSVCAVFYPDGIGKKPVLCRVRPLGILQKCPDMMRCCKGRKCPKAHSGVELHFWNKLQQGELCTVNYCISSITLYPKLKTNAAAVWH